MLFGSAMDVLDRFFPDPEKHRMLRAMLSFLAVNSTYKGPWTPGSAACLAFALASTPDTRLLKKLDGGIGALGQHVQGIFESHGGEVRMKAKVERILTEGGARHRRGAQGRRGDHRADGAVERRPGRHAH